MKNGTLYSLFVIVMSFGINVRRKSNSKRKIINTPGVKGQIKPYSLYCLATSHDSQHTVASRHFTPEQRSN